MLRLLGKEKGLAGTVEGGLEVLKGFLTQAGIPAGEYVFYDGSGLSRQNLVTPHAVVALLQYAAKQPWGQLFSETFPIAGLDGSLADRFHGTPAQGRDPSSRSGGQVCRAYRSRRVRDRPPHRLRKPTHHASPLTEQERENYNFHCAEQGIVTGGNTQADAASENRRLQPMHFPFSSQADGTPGEILRELDRVSCAATKIKREQVAKLKHIGKHTNLFGRPRTVFQQVFLSLSFPPEKLLQPVCVLRVVNPRLQAVCREPTEVLADHDAADWCCSLSLD